MCYGMQLNNLVSIVVAVMYLVGADLEGYTQCKYTPHEKVYMYNSLSVTCTAVLVSD